jgi:hypothetical protein
MLCPNVFGQSGTAMPASVVVTSPPTQSNGNVAHANTTAQRCGQGEAAVVIELVIERRIQLNDEWRMANDE